MTFWKARIGSGVRAKKEAATGGKIIEILETSCR